MASIISGSDNFNTNSVSFGNEQVFTSSGTFNVPLGVSRVKVTVIGAGGNGAAGVDSVNSGGGGGAGGYVVSYVAVTSGGTATVTVGTNAGTRTSSFAGGSTITASGGSNGTYPNIVGASGSASMFGQTYYGNNVARFSAGVQTGVVATSSSIWVSGTANTSSTGSCYDHGYGAGGSLHNSTNTGRQVPLGLGAGGGGGGSDTGFQTAGTGTNGIVIVEW